MIHKFKIMIRFIKRKIKALAIHIVRHSAYYKEINQKYHELWIHTQLNNPEWSKCSEGSLYDGCIKTLENHPQHYA
jgi:hypothetical protein